MSDRKLILLAAFTLGMAGPGIPALLALWGKPISVIAGVVLGAVTIGSVVRLVNRRGDPSRVRRPPDAP
jgi:hypothetical protein